MNPDPKTNQPTANPARFNAAGTRNAGCTLDYNMIDGTVQTAWAHTAESFPNPDFTTFLELFQSSGDG